MSDRPDRTRAASRPCAVLTWDRRATRQAGVVVIRPCGAPAGQVVTISHDTLFAVCGRHNARLARAGVHSA